MLHRPGRQRAGPRVVSRTVHSPAFRLRRGGGTTRCCGRRCSLRKRRSTRTRRPLPTRRSIHSHSYSGRWVHCRTSRSFPQCRKRRSSGPATVLFGGPEPPTVVDQTVVTGRAVRSVAGWYCNLVKRSPRLTLAPSSKEEGAGSPVSRRYPLDELRNGSG